MRIVARFYFAELAHAKSPRHHVFAPLRWFGVLLFCSAQ